MSDFVLHEGDCLATLRTLPDCSIDAVCTDPPYALVFMGKKWDTGEVAFSFEFWAEVLRVLKPGGHVVAFGGTRTYHRMVCAIEDAGFEIRDAIMWHYGTGFPKSLDVSKQLDKAAGAVREVIRTRTDGRGASPSKIENHGVGDTGIGHADGSKQTYGETAPATDAARQWAGWGTALKPATEIICLARKPLSEPTVAANVLRWGTGALNIDGTRIATGDSLGGGDQSARTKTKVEGWDRPWMQDATMKAAHADRVNANVAKAEALGRWPANVIHDGSDEVVGMFPVTTNGTGAVKKATSAGWQANAYGKESRPSGTPNIEYGDTGSAARFFYSAKASKADRAESKHPTVKPVNLMRWLVRLVTPPGGTVLDPFAGSGTTGLAARLEGFRSVMCEREAEYIDDIKRRTATHADLLTAAE